jgi:hypothetical protein
MFPPTCDLRGWASVESSRRGPEALQLKAGKISLWNRGVFHAGKRYGT